MAEKKKAKAPSPPPKAALLLDLQSDLMQGRIEGVFTFANREFRMHTLNDGEALWRDGFISMASNMALLSSRKLATVAASISHINDAGLDEMFPLPTDEQLLGLVQNDPEELKSYFREQLYGYLQQFEDVIITEFFKFYTSLEERRAEVITRLKASSRETDSSKSNSTSSVEDGLSSVEQDEEPAILGSSFGG